MICRREGSALVISGWSGIFPRFLIKNTLNWSKKSRCVKSGYSLDISSLIVFFVTCQVLILPRPVLAQFSAAVQHKVVIYLFWGDGCPHCAAAKPFLNDLTHRYANTELRAYEVWYVPENQELFQKNDRGLWL